jgi:septal ring factor EnvC (AmiA/AmiB activator)
MADQVRASYKLGKQSELKVLFNQESPDGFARMMKYHSYFMAAHNDKLASYQETITRIDAITPSIEQKTIELSVLQQQLDRQRDQLKKLHGQRQTALAKVNANLKNKEQALRQLVEDRNRLQALMNQVTKRVAGAAQSPAYVPLPSMGERFTARKGRLPWPTQGRLLHRFGSARIAGQINWSGAYIGAPQGNSVIAVHHGRVVFADYFGGHGLLVIVDHGEGYMSLYAHNQVLLKKAGELVKAGEPIARVGNSGGQASDGLYFEIRHQGKPIDPSAWLAKA